MFGTDNPGGKAPGLSMTSRLTIFLGKHCASVDRFLLPYMEGISCIVWLLVDKEGFQSFLSIIPLGGVTLKLLFEIY